VTPTRSGSLTIVGAGIRAGLQMTQEARARIERADKVLYLLAEDVPTAWLHALNASAESMAALYGPGRRYGDVYEDIVTTILEWTRKDLDVCAVTYGHPSVFDTSTAEAAKRARAEGFRVRIFPGISALDCLFVDLEVDPGSNGCQLYDATDFLVHRRKPDVAVPLVLFQISVIGGSRTTSAIDRSKLRVLSERLIDLYAPDHEAVIYEATPYPVGKPTIERRKLGELADADIAGMSSLYVPPLSEVSGDREMMSRLGMQG
jgi:uncharacterized protein YabN with tetrapyrrole methylase and pyrophosphatase domain